MLDSLVLMRSVVVRNQVNVDIPRRLALDLLRESQPLHVRVLLLRAIDELAVQVVQRCKQSDSITRRTVWSLMDRLRPRPALSPKPASPSRSKRWDHLLMHGRLAPSLRAASRCEHPAPRKSTIRARNTSRRGVVPERARRSSSTFSSAVISKTVTGRGMVNLLAGDPSKQSMYVHVI